MASASTYRPPLTTRQLLVSVQNAAEAELAFQAGVAWVDLKDPAVGSLGQPSADTCLEFVQTAKAYPNSRISLALGEYRQANWQSACPYLEPFDVAKVGLAGLASITADTIDTMSKMRGKLVPALYADWQRAQSPEPARVVELARAIGAPYVLVDTYAKDGLGLLHWMNLTDLQQLCDAARGFGAGLVVAGSLRTSDWPTLEQLGSVTIGIRGAACESSADRTSNLSPSRIQQWLNWCQAS